MKKFNEIYNIINEKTINEKSYLETLVPSSALKKYPTYTEVNNMILSELSKQLGKDITIEITQYNGNYIEFELLINNKYLGNIYIVDFDKHSHIAKKIKKIIDDVVKNNDDIIDYCEVDFDQYGSKVNLSIDIV